MKRRTTLCVKSPCGEEVYLRDGQSIKIALEQHKKDCLVCNPPPPPPVLVRQNAVIVDVENFEVPKNTLF